MLNVFRNTFQLIYKRTPLALSALLTLLVLFAPLAPLAASYVHVESREETM